MRHPEVGGWGLDRPSSGDGGFSGSGQAGLSGGVFGSSGDSQGNNVGGGIGRALGGGRAINRSIEETVTVTLLPEKEGMFMFQHNNYEVKSARRGSTVIRRYSDFVWLLDCLHKRYPFRQLPLLPPKRVAGKLHLLVPSINQITNFILSQWKAFVCGCNIYREAETWSRTVSECPG